MATADRDERKTEDDAQAVKDKFGSFADVYAESRSDAAEITGDEAAEQHWDEVAATVQDEPER
ncbi:MAG TPA: hypothetical protein VJM15_04035 [Sphingomicrobium sp.]|nr:hypothetical protein [Sphingomicrobium sp.]